MSHDCDLAATSEIEPNVEIISAIPIEKLGANSHSKIARRLDLEFQCNKSPVFLQLTAASKQFIDKVALSKFSPRDDLNLDGHGLFTLGRWLASRYYRAAFPDSFMFRLSSPPNGGKKLLKKIESILEQGGEHIRGVFFDLDGGENIERAEMDNCYSLGIVVLYDSSKNEPAAASSAEKVAKELESLFSTAFYSREASKWLGIELQYCDAISDAVLTVAEQGLLREWRLEHMSLRESPAQVLTIK